MLSPSVACYAILREFEGCVLRAYPDPASPLAKARRLQIDQRPTNWFLLKGDPWTCGWGSTGPDIGPNTVWTQDQADRRLIDDAVASGVWVEKLVHEPLTQNQFDALTTLVYNIGAHAFAGSTMHRLLVQGLYSAAAEEFPKWDHAGGEVNKGLLRRREAEQTLFLTQPASIS